MPKFVLVTAVLNSAQVDNNMASGFAIFSFSQRSCSRSPSSIHTQMAAASEYFDNKDRYEYYTDNASRVQGHELQRLNNEWQSSSSNINRNARATKLDKRRNGVRYHNKSNGYSYAYHVKSTVNGMNDYSTDNVDRVGGFIASDDAGRGIRKVNSIPAGINGSVFSSSLVPYACNNSSQHNDDSRGFGKRGTVNGMFDYYTNLFDRTGNAHLENNNNWNLSMKNTYKIKAGVRASASSSVTSGMVPWQDPSKKNNRSRSTVNGMFNYETKFADRVGGFLANGESAGVSPSYSRGVAGKNRDSGRGSTVNGMSDYETDNIDRIGGFLGTNSGDSW